MFDDNTVTACLQPGCNSIVLPLQSEITNINISRKMDKKLLLRIVVTALLLLAAWLAWS